MAKPDTISTSNSTADPHRSLRSSAGFRFHLFPASHTLKLNPPRDTVPPLETSTPRLVHGPSYQDRGKWFFYESSDWLEDAWEWVVPSIRSELELVPEPAQLQLPALIPGNASRAVTFSDGALRPSEPGAGGRGSALAQPSIPAVLDLNPRAARPFSAVKKPRHVHKLPDAASGDRFKNEATESHVKEDQGSHSTPRKPPQRRTTALQQDAHGVWRRSDEPLRKIPLRHPLAFRDVESVAAPTASSDLCATGAEYCSAASGTIQPFMGALDSVDGVWKMLAARAYKKELIMLMSDHHHLDMPLNAIVTLHSHGYEHYLLLMLNGHECKHADAYVHALGCGWVDFARVGSLGRLWHQLRRLWVTRWLVLLRVVQLDHNILMMDADNGITTEIYRYLKAEPLQRYTMLTPYEPNAPGINCGLVYVQNAAKQGPVVWMAAEVASRTIRWLENLPWLLKKFPGWQADQEWLDLHVLYEQDIFNDAACSTMAGRPLFRNSFGPHAQFQAAAKAKWDAVHEALCMQWQEAELRYVPAFAELFPGRTSERVLFFRAALPVKPAAWNESLGGEPFAPVSASGSSGAANGTSGNSTLTEGLSGWLSAGAKVWPGAYDSEAGRSWQGSNASELVVRAPPWLLSRWPEAGVRGEWNPALLRQPRGVLAHAIVMQGNDGEGKYGVFKVYGWWHHEADAALRGALIFGASTQEVPIPRVIAMSPQVNMYHRTLEDFMTATRNLAIAAAIAAAEGQPRVIVWPRLHCWSPWVRWAAKWDPDTFASPVVDTRILSWGPLDDLSCVTFLLMGTGCHKVGMPYYDFEHLLSRLPQSSSTPSARNLAFASLSPPPRAYAKPSPGVANGAAARTRGLRRGVDIPQHDQLFTVDASEVASELKRLADEPVIFLKAPIRIKAVPESVMEHVLHLESKCDKPPLWEAA